MKKNYVKPSLYFEDFSLMDTIAAGGPCGILLAQATIDTCQDKHGEMFRGSVCEGTVLPIGEGEDYDDAGLPPAVS